MSNHIQQINKPFKATVGEPWDFVSDAGTGQLGGRIEAIYKLDDGGEILTMSVSPFTSEKSVVEYVIGVSRYREGYDISQDVDRQYPITLNMYYLEMGRNIIHEFESLGISVLTNSKFIVGTIREYK